MKWNPRYLKTILLVISAMFLLWLYCHKDILNKEPSLDKKPHFDFKYLIQNDICKGDIFLVVLVHSAVDHFEHRKLIRDTWGHPGADLPTIKIVFLLGIAEEFREKIDDENEKFRDLVQGNFIDSYRNLTYKHAMGLSWASTHCNRARYLMKVDDDIFVDIYQFIAFIKDKASSFDLKNNVACYSQTAMPVVRDANSKWFVAKDEYASDTFENYCSGWAYLATTTVANRLFRKIQQLPYFWVDDVHVTGTVAKLANIGRIRLNFLYALETDGLVEWTRSAANLKWDKMFAPTWGDLDLSRRAHRKAYRCYITNCKCCYKTPTTPKPTTTSTTVRGFAEPIFI